MISYLDLIDESKRKEQNIIECAFYKTFGRYNEQRDQLKRQAEITDWLEKRFNDLKNNL